MCIFVGGHIYANGAAQWVLNMTYTPSRPGGVATIDGGQLPLPVGHREWLYDAGDGTEPTERVLKLSDITPEAGSYGGEQRWRSSPGGPLGGLRELHSSRHHGWATDASAKQAGLTPGLRVVAGWEKNGVVENGQVGQVFTLDRCEPCVAGRAHYSTEGGAKIYYDSREREW